MKLQLKFKNLVKSIIKDELSTVPYGESSAFTKGFKSPYYNESHKIFKLAVR